MSSITLQDVSLYIQTFQVLHPKILLPFLQKGEKTAELVFLFPLKSGLRFQINPVYSFLISKRFLHHPDCSYLAYVPLTLLFSMF